MMNRLNWWFVRPVQNRMNGPSSWLRTIGPVACGFAVWNLIGPSYILCHINFYLQFKYKINLISLFVDHIELLISSIFLFLFIKT